MLFDEAALRTLVTDTVRAAVREELRCAPGTAEYIAVQTAADRIEVAPATIREWINRGKLKRYHAGRELRVKVTELEALVASEPLPYQTVGVVDATPEDMAVRDALRDIKASKRRRNE